MTSPAVHITAEDLNKLPTNPHCPHGPTILFRHTGKKAGDDGYYACSAYRDSKECRFHQPYAAKSGNPKAKHETVGEMERSSKKRKHDEMVEASRPEKLFTASKIPYCSRCSRILEGGDVEKHQHKEVEQVDPRFPSRFLLPLHEKQNEAQYFFSENTTEFLLQLIVTQKVKLVLHIGCPRLHEEAIASRKIQSSNFLLDMDGRFSQFFPRNTFAQYNMFNHHFFSQSGVADYQSFVRGVPAAKDLLIIMDPPFGGRVEVLAHNLRRLFAEIGGECGVVWIFPYFMEKHIIREFPSFTMLDYKVEYDNHRKFKGTGAGATRGSPVRIFTNISPATASHPTKEGYWFCGECDRFSARENRHCLACGVCPSKDGKEWRHCRTCGKCVKSDWSHCKKCKRCHAKTCLAKADESGTGSEQTNNRRKSWKFSGVRKDTIQH